MVFYRQLPWSVVNAFVRRDCASLPKQFKDVPGSGAWEPLTRTVARRS